MEENLREKVNESTSFISSHLKKPFTPNIGIILGTGLGGLVEHIEVETCVEYDNIPHFPTTTVATHEGKLILGKIGKKNIVAMQGRFHYYEGHSIEKVTYPIRVMRALGAKILIVSNAAGGMNPLFELSDLMLIVDHINFTGINPLIGPNDEKLGPRFPDMSEVYDSQLIRLAETVALEENIKLHKGVYIGVTGPSLETKAEYRMMRTWGADAVGMSTVPEVIVAVHSGFRILGISCITDLCLPDALEPVDIKKILKAAKQAEPKLTKIVQKVLERI